MKNHKNAQQWQGSYNITEDGLLKLQESAQLREQYNSDGIKIIAVYDLEIHDDVIIR